MGAANINTREVDEANFLLAQKCVRNLAVEEYPLDDGGKFVALTQNGMHAVAYAICDASGNYIENGRHHPLVEKIEARLRNACFDYDGRDVSIHPRGESPLPDEMLLGTSAARGVEGRPDFVNPLRPKHDSRSPARHKLHY